MTRYKTLSQSEISLLIESFVQAVEKTDIPAFRITQNRSGYERVEKTKLSHYFIHIKQMVDLFDDRVGYSYSEHLQAFRDACHFIRLERHPGGPVCLDDRGTAYLDHPRSMNVLTAQIRRLTRAQRYRRRAGDRRDLARQQQKEIIEYTDAVLSRYSRTTIIRVNLYYRTEAQVRLRIEHVFADLNRLTAEHKGNRIFDQLIGYIHAVEQGERHDGSGYHIHAAYFFNGNQVCRDVWKARDIGELWEEVTRGQGYAHSCNHDKERYGDNLGIGPVQRANQAIRPHTHYAMEYLVKNDQHLRLKPVGARCLRKGSPRHLR